MFQYYIIKKFEFAHIMGNDITYNYRLRVTFLTKNLLIDADILKHMLRKHIFIENAIILQRFSSSIQ